MKTRIALCIALLAACTMRAAELTPAEADGLLKQLQDLREKQPDAQADFREEKISHLVLKPLVSEGTVSFEAPNKFRREVKGGNSSLSVSDGKTMWVYYPNFKEAEHYSIGQRSFFDDSLSALTAGLNFEHIEEFYTFKAFREDGGGYQFQLTPKKPELKRLLDHVNIWMDSEFKVQKVDLFMQKGDRLTTTYTNVRRSPLPASTFEFKPGADVHISYPLGK